MKLLAAIFLSLCCVSAHAQTNSLRFRITHFREVPGCKQGQGIVFEQGHISADSRIRPVIVMIYLEKNDGTFVALRRSYPAGTVNVKLDIFGCDYTGNNYSYIKYADDTDFNFPTVDEIYKRHKEVLATVKPEFIVSTTKANPKCPNSFIIQSGFVYSPAGGRVDIKLLVETISGEWRTINLYRYGTGPVPINYAACDLTGNTKAIASFGYNVNLSDVLKN
jgi:hypothetical protein